MKVLMVNKFLFPKGGAETYMFEAGECLIRMGHKVEYFGMEHEGRCVGNSVNSYTSEMDFHSGRKLSRLTYPIKTIYSSEARKKIRPVLENFRPDVVHLNNFNYQLTPSIILEIIKWRKRTNNRCRIVYTAHDFQLVCPAHLCRNPITNENCEKCLNGSFFNCAKGKCIHKSAARSLVGTAEAVFWKLKGTYRYIDTVICCSEFIKERIVKNPRLAGKCITMHNFVGRPDERVSEKKDYVLYFGRFSEEKGIRTLIKACGELPDIPFVFAGSGPLESELNAAPNIKNVGFLCGNELAELIRGARFSVCPSEWYENCPFSVMESQVYGTPVLGADIGGIPELIRTGETGELFESRDTDGLAEKIRAMYEDKEKADRYSAACLNAGFDTVEEYCEKLLRLYASPESADRRKGI